MSETKRLIEKDRPEKIDEDEDGTGRGSTAATTSGSTVLAKIRRRQSPPFSGGGGGTDYGSSGSKYGTLDTSAGMKRSLLVDTYPKTHITRKQFAIAFIAFIVFAAAVGVTLILGLPRLDAKRTEYFAAKFYESTVRQTPFHRRSVVVTGSEECSRVGESVLTRGNGSAMDAALAALYCSLVASPHLTRFDSALSGLHYSTNATPTAFSSALQVVPIALSNDSLSSPSLLETTRLLHGRFGRLPWSSILGPSVQLATAGAPVTAQLAALLHASHGQLLRQSTPLIRAFTKDAENGTRPLLAQGDLLRMPGLAETLSLLSAQGSETASSVNGTSPSVNGTTILKQLVEDLSAALNATVSSLSLPATSSLQIEAPLSIHLLNGTLTLLTAPPPSSGVVLSQILSVLDRVVLSNQSAIELCSDDNRTLKEGAYEFHYLIEALKFGAATAQTMSVNSKAAVLLDANKLQEMATKIIDFSEYPEAEHARSFYGFPEATPEKKTTVAGGAQIIVFDGTTGESVSLEVINRDELFDGTKIFSEKTGIILSKHEKNENSNEQMIYPTTPVFVVDSAANKIRLASSSSGPESISALSQVLYKIFYNCQELKSATDESRFYYQAESDLIQYESTFPQAYIDLLMKLFGHYNLKSVSVNSKRATVSSLLNMEVPVNTAAQRNTTQQQQPAQQRNQVVTMTDFRSADGYADGD